MAPSRPEARAPSAEPRGPSPEARAPKPDVQSAAIPELTKPVNDFANVIDRASAAGMEKMIRGLLAASGDAVVVATVDTIEPYGDIREYAVKMFDNHGRGVGQKGKDNGLLVLLAVKERRVWVEVGYDLEEFITDGFAGETSRNDMVPHFRSGEYGRGLREGVTRIIQRIASSRGVSIEGVPAAEAPNVVPSLGCSPVLIVLVVLLIWYVNSRPPRIRSGRRWRTWGIGPWSGWNSGVGGFGGSDFGGGSFGGGGGSDFGGFGGGRSGGGGGGAGW